MRNNAKKYIAIISSIIVILSICVLLAFTVLAQTSTIHIHSFDELNTEPHSPDSHEGQTSRSTLELDYRSKQLLGAETLNTGTAHYPRLASLDDGSYIMFYNTGRTGPSIQYVTSTDLRTWSAPTDLFTEDETYIYATADSVVLDNGDILVCAAKMPQAWNYYISDMSTSFLVTKRSTDNGKTWSEEQIVYTGMAWEPSLIQLDTGEIQIYFTHTAPFIGLYGYFEDVRSTGSAIIRSTDNGKTWTPNVTAHNVDPADPYAAWRVMQQKIGTKTVTDPLTGKTVEKAWFNDQMPVAIQLNNGSIAVVVESYLHFNDHPVNGGKYQLSIGFSHDNWATPLGMEQEGPADKLLNIDRAAGPYISQFASGEVIVSHTNTSSHLEYKIFDTTAHSYSGDFTFNPGVKNLWSSSEVISSHKIAMLVDDGNDTAAAETSTFQISYTELALNHNISAKMQKTTLDGNNADWNNNTEALFIGSLSQAQVSIRSAYDDTYVYFLVEVLDDYLSSSDAVEIRFGTSLSSTSYYGIKVGPSGLVSKTYNYTTDVAKYVNGTIGNDTDTDVGYLVEIRINRADLSKISFTNALYVLPYLYNKDGSTTYSYDSITGASIATSAKTFCPMITYTDVNKYDTIYVSDAGNDNASGDSISTAVKTLARAARSLKDSGTIIITDNISITSDQHLRSEASKIRIRGLTGKEVITASCDIFAYTDLDIDSIAFVSATANKFLFMQYNDLYIGSGFSSSKTATTHYGIIGGFNAYNATSTYSQLCSDEDCTIEINAGTWRYIRGGNRRSGTSAPLGHYSGNCTIVINGGTFEASTTGLTDDVSSPTGMNSSSGNNTMIINGGIFNGSVYAQSRSGGISTSANGFTYSPDYSGSVKIIYTGGTVKGNIKASQTLGVPASNINYPYNSIISVEYVHGMNSVIDSGFDSSSTLGAYGIPFSNIPDRVEINGKNTAFNYYGGKIFIPVDCETEKAIAVIYSEEVRFVLMIDPSDLTWSDLGLSDSFPQYLGTAIRTQGNAGLRFKSSIDFSSVPSSVKITRVGSIATFATNLADIGYLNLSADKCGDSIAYDLSNLTEHWYEEKENGEKIFTAVLINFAENEYTSAVTYRPYVTFEYQGQSYTLYGECVTRSIYGVAMQCCGNDSAYPFVQQIITASDGKDNDIDHSFFDR